MSSRKSRLSAIALTTLATCAGTLSGCATVTTGSDQSLTVTTIPEGATCLMTRDGQTIGAISATPGTVQIDKDKDPILIECKMDGHQTTKEVLDSTFHGATLGNVLIGGVIGIVIDAGSGAMNKYPQSIELVLVPQSFASEEERDTFFDGVEAKIRATEKARIASVEQSCGDDEQFCAEERNKVESEIAERIDELHEQRGAATIVAAADTDTTVETEASAEAGEAVTGP